MENPRVTSFSTDEIYKSPVAVYNDTYAETRKELDYTYHSHYTLDRQIVQDKIITEFKNQFDHIQSMYCSLIVKFL
jgi:hypothetical protein